MTIARNIRQVGNSFVVAVTRRPLAFKETRHTLEGAIKLRDILEAQHPKHRTWDLTPRKPKRTSATLYRERLRAGVCPECGGQRTDDFIACRECRRVRGMKLQANREQQHESNSRPNYIS
jgi:hypothetical protein